MRTAVETNGYPTRRCAATLITGENRVPNNGKSPCVRSRTATYDDRAIDNYESLKRITGEVRDVCPVGGGERGIAETPPPVSEDVVKLSPSLRIL